MRHESPRLRRGFFFARITTIRSMSFTLKNLPRTDVPGLYVHVPFCFHKCHYCDFYSITRQTPQRMGRFVDLLLREAAHWQEEPPHPSPLPRSTAGEGTGGIRTVFFGGGTPSLLPM